MPALRLKLDENLPPDATEALGSAKHDVATVLAEGLGGRPDTDVLAVCRKEDRILVTLDLGFADIRTHPPRDTPGLVVLRLRRQDAAYVLRILRTLAKLLARESPAQKLWIVEEHRVRVRE